MHELNKELVMNCIYFNEPISRIEVSRKTGISKSTVTNITKELLDDGSLSVYGRDDTHEACGRCPELLNINRKSKYFIGINIGRTKIVTAITDIYGTIIDVTETPMLPTPEFYEVMGLVNQNILDIRKKNSAVVDGKLIGIGVSVSGIVDVQEGVVIHSPNFSWNNVPVRAEIEEIQKLPVFVDNCTHCIARGYVMFNKEDRVSSFLCVNIAYGIGSAVVNNYDIFGDGKTYISELGHVTVEPNGAMCACGKRGCLENYASGRAIAQTAKDYIRNGENTLITSLCHGEIDKVDTKLVAEAAERGDPLAQRIIKNAAEKIGLVISHAINILDFDAVILEGGVSRTKANFIERIREVAISNSMKNKAKHMSIQRGTIGRYAESLGAAGLVINSLVGISCNDDIHCTLS